MSKKDLENGLDESLEDTDMDQEDTDLDDLDAAEAAEAAEASAKVVLPSGTMVTCDDGIERPVITREEAIANGVNRYFTGIECANGHMVERKVKGYICTTCARNRQKERKKVRAAGDPEFKKKLANKRADKHKARYAADPLYRAKVLGRAKDRRVRAAAAKRSMKAAAEAEIVGQ